MRLFGRYLVEAGIIDNDTLLKALIEQAKSTPSIIETVHHLGLLNTTEQLEVLEFQHINNCGFIDACKKLGRWTDKLQQEILSFIQKKRKPLGHIIASMGAIEFDTLTSALDDFIVEYGEENSTKIAINQNDFQIPPDHEEKINEHIEVQNDSSNQKRNDVIQSSKRENNTLAFHLHEIDPAMIESYTYLIDTEKRSTLENLIKKLSDDPNTFKQAGNSIVIELSSAKAGANFIRANISAHIYAQIESLIHSINENDSIDKVRDVDEICKIFILLLDEIWNLKLTLQSSHSEASYWQTANSQERFSNLQNQINEKINIYSQAN
ncbi:MAG: hypothetical protein R3B45_04810 [Bdellovibrionota bacterium]